MTVRLVTAILLSTLAVASIKADLYTDLRCDGRQVLVELFQWKWEDVARECEVFLGPRGVCAVQVSPPSEHVYIEDTRQTWWHRYQPVSYILNSQSGSEEEFRVMVERCTKAGVRVIPEVVLNNMAEQGLHGTGSAGTSYNSDNLDFPGVPYDYHDFHNNNMCSTDGNYTSALQLRTCSFAGLTDLNQTAQHVRERITAYLDHLLDVGVRGFVINAASLMLPSDLAALQGSVKNSSDGTRPVFAMDVYDFDGNGPIKAEEYSKLGYVADFQYSLKIAEGLRNFKKFSEFVDAPYEWTGSDKTVAFVDNHLLQRLSPLVPSLTFKQPREFSMATAFTLAFTNGPVRLMSSYDFDDPELGPPVTLNSSLASVEYTDNGTCSGGWICEHKWPLVSKMAAFRNAVAHKDLNHWTSSEDLVAFSRGRVGFFAMTSASNFSGRVNTGLAAGTYCDILSDCSRQIVVKEDGSTQLDMRGDANPVTAVIANVPDINYQRTLIFIEKVTKPGEYVFFRGGLDHGRLRGCTTDADTSKCAIPVYVRNINKGDFFSSYEAWRAGDAHLDWYGAERLQGSFGNVRSLGTPAVWTSNDPSSPGYHPLNVYGSHYWLVDMDVDCTKTENGFFELKAYLNGWEPDAQSKPCTGDGSGDAMPFTSSNHVAICGRINVFHWGQSRCERTRF
ncbi:alpha-amylase-like [Pomacea canaliculata]|uniref:alpha-amylase-like n=1 Tax=Pomacea canaliculata TaxID=400727 RepID=UPI000D73664E|nr:alpha-amylase-like [Pomacea canaliculata]